MDMNEIPKPAQYSRFGGSVTLLQRALQRAARIAPTSQIKVTALEEYRHLWESTLWFVRPEHRFVCENRAGSSMTTAAAILSIAELSPSQVVVMLPGRCHVFQESMLADALDHALAALPMVPEGALSLAMIDCGDAIDEDYVLVTRPATGPGLGVLSMVRRPTTWVSRHLAKQGALVASGILIGYAGVFAAHISKQWPGLTSKLNQVVKSATAASAECELSLQLTRGAPPSMLTSLRWSAPAFAQRAVCVDGCGWSGLKSARAVARTRDYLAAVACVPPASSVRSDIFESPPRHSYLASAIDL